MRRGQAKVLRLVALTFICLMALPSTLLAEAKYAGFQAETTVPFAAGEIKPELEGAFYYHSMQAKIGEPNEKGLQKIKLVFDAKNMTDKDYFVYLTATLLDAEGQTIASRTKKRKIDDEEREKVRVKFKKLESSRVESITDLEIKVAYEKE